ncbi:DUF3486 domain-containing protein [Bordetella tumbae]|uniref:hypothetical protein n=1 Tax=Bordetella tumbae TaxID=1649139 RepID=UPI0039EED228
MSQKLNKIRTQIAALKAEIREVKGAALDDAGIAARVDRWLNAKEKTSERNFSDLAYELAYEPRHTGGTEWPLLDERVKLVPDLALSLLVSTNREAFRSILINAAKAGVEGRQVADKGAELARLEAQLYELELAEEAEFERLEAAGETVLRRADANPRAILGFPL